MADLNTATSIVDLLKSKGIDSSFSNRTKLASQYGIQNYAGTADQNTQLISLVSKPAPAPTSAAAPIVSTPPIAAPVTKTPEATPGSPTPAPIVTSTPTPIVTQAPAPTVNPAPVQPASVAPYTIQSGDTLSALAVKNNTTVADIMKLNPQITNPNLIYAGKTLTLPGTSPAPAPSNGATSMTDAGKPAPDFSSVNDVNSANKVINDQQASDIANAAKDNAPGTRKTLQDYVDEVTKAVTPPTTTPQPAPLNTAQLMTDLRVKYGVNDLETQVNDLQAQRADILAQFNANKVAEQGKTVAMGVIGGRISEEQQQAQDKLDAIDRVINTATNQLKTKYDVINTMMDAAKTDYSTASAAYDKQFSENVSILNAARTAQSAAQTDAEQAQTSAKADAQIVLNAYTARGATYDQLSPSEKTNLTKLGVQSGLGADFFSNVLAVSSGKEILTTIASADQTTATIIYKDGTVKSIKTGLPAKSTTSGGSTAKPTADEVKVAYKQSMSQQLEGVKGTDQFVSPADYKKARQAWITNTPYDGASFDATFSNYINPDHAADYS